MINIVKARSINAQLLSEIGRISFIQAHENSASDKDISYYVNVKLSKENFKEDLEIPSKQTPLNRSK